MRPICSFIVVAALSFIVACSVPSSKVRADFIKEHPTYTVLSINVGEGDGTAAYFHIKYKKPGDEKVYEDVWQYLNDGKGGWSVNHKQTLN